MPLVSYGKISVTVSVARMYDKIRGKGWTYGISMSASVTEGRLTVNFVRSSHLNNAYVEFRNIIENYTNPGELLGLFEFEVKNCTGLLVTLPAQFSTIKRALSCLR